MADDNVVMFRGITQLDLPAERVLQGAIDNGVDPVVVVGKDRNGEFYVASSLGSGADATMLMHIAIRRMIDMADD